MNILSDNTYEKQYNEIIVPFCRQHEKSEFYTGSDGKRLHYLKYINENPKGIAVIVHGFTECAEKFTEAAYYFFNEGYTVYAPELRGHGLSYKAPAKEYTVTSNSFFEYADDLAVLFESICAEGLPVCVYTHSLGGLAVLMMLQRHKEITVDRLVLSSPMICGKMGMPTALARVAAGTLVRLGKGDMQAPGKCVFTPEKPNADAACPQRERHSMAMKKNNKAYQTCGPDFRWVYASLKARDFVLDAENIKKLLAPMLVIKPEYDGQLSSYWQNRFISLCRKYGKSLSVIETQNTRHEIYQSGAAQLQPYYEQIMRFFGN